MPSVEQQRDVHPVGHAVEQADLEPPALPGDAARDQRLQHAGVGGHAAGDVAGGDADAARPGGMAGDRGKTGFGLDQKVVRLHRGVIADIAVAGDVDGDQTRVPGTQGVGAEAGAGGGTRGEILDEDVGAGQQAVAAARRPRVS